MYTKKGNGISKISSCAVVGNCPVSSHRDSHNNRQIITYGKLTVYLMVLGNVHTTFATLAKYDAGASVACLAAVILDLLVPCCTQQDHGGPTEAKEVVEAVWHTHAEASLSVSERVSRQAGSVHLVPSYPGLCEQ
jgi:hypothetical protein